MPGLPKNTRVPVGVDPSRASIARAYDFALGGTDNYEIDREVVRQLQAIAPEVLDIAVGARSFLIRACRFLAEKTGVTQFLDCGSGLPTAENVHQVVQRFVPEARVVYIDNDPVVLAHGRAILAENENTRFVSADVFDPAEVMENPVVRQHLDFSEPIALFQFATLHHFVGQDDGPAQIMKEYIDALAPGSYVGITHYLDPENEHSEFAHRVADTLRNGPAATGTFRTMSEIEGLFDGLEMVEPGVTLCAEWWPDGPQVNPLNAAEHCIAGGIGIKR